jgi:hypothetical protein
LDPQYPCRKIGSCRDGLELEARGIGTTVPAVTSQAHMRAHPPSGAARLVMRHGQLSPHSPNTPRGDGPPSPEPQIPVSGKPRALPLCAPMRTPCYPLPPISDFLLAPAWTTHFSHVKYVSAMPRLSLHPRAVPHSRRRRLRWVHPRDVTTGSDAPGHKLVMGPLKSRLAHDYQAPNHPHKASRVPARPLNTSTLPYSPPALLPAHTGPRRVYIHANKA